MKKISTLFLSLIFAIFGFTTSMQLEMWDSKTEAVVAQQIEFDRLIDNDIASNYNVSQNEETLFLTENYTSYYYKNLTENFGNNTKGSCGYVAIGMLLSYWDTFWDDNMIPENYDMITLLEDNSISLASESPGIYREESLLVSGLTNEQYYQVIEQYSSAYFHLKLIQMGKEEFGQYVFDGDSNPTGMTYNEYIELLEYYLYTYRNYTEEEVEIIAYNDSPQNVRNQTINLIKQGIPVKLGVGNSSGGHAVIAYDYDEENDEIYVHAGWNEDFTHVTLGEIGYDQYWNAIAITFNNATHNCSNNFKYSNEYQTVETHCVCDLDIHPTRYSITYNNITFQGTTASVVFGSGINQSVPTTYAWIEEVDLSDIMPFFSAFSPHSPQLVFIEWCLDSGLTQSIEAIPQYSTGDIALYAKWRYDYNAVTSTREYVLRGDFQKFTYCDTASIGMGATELYEDLTSIGIEYLAVRINIRLESQVGVPKKIYFYGDSTENSYLGVHSFTHYTGEVYTITKYFSLDTVANINTLYLRYGGGGVFASTWSTDKIFLEVMYVTEENDVEAVPFTWANENPFLS